ncbi:hypothetical protein ACF0H5_020232 [Mactra antiquata]
MMFYICCLVLMTPAVFTLELEPALFNDMRQVFEGTILKHLQGEYMMFLPMMIKQNKTMKECKELMVNTKEMCRSCVETTCPTYDLELLPFPESHGSINWQAWKEVGSTLFGSPSNFNKLLALAAEKYRTKLGHLNPKYKPVEPELYGPYDDKETRKISPTAVMNMVDITLTGLDLGMQLMNNFGGFTDMMSGITSGLGDAFNGVAGGFTSVVGDVGNGIGSFFSGLFGRKRRDTREISLRLARLRKFRQMEESGLYEDEPCWLQCTECEHFNHEPMEVVTRICSEQLMRDVMSMTNFMDLLSSLLIKNDPSYGGLITKIEYDPENFELSTMSYGDVYVTAELPSGPVRYLSEYRLRIQSPRISAVEIAEELVSKWGL